MDRQLVMRSIFLLTAAVVAACGAPETGSGQGAASESRSRDQAEVQQGAYIPKPDSLSDERPWASAFANYSFEKSGIPGTGDARALSWLAWGVPLRQPAVGAVAVLDFGNGRGHVGLVVGTYGGMIVLMGGDQSNAVNTTAFDPKHITAYRWPAGQPAPASFELPSVRPEGAPDGDDGRPRGERSNAAGSAGDPASIDTVEYRSPGGEQWLRIRRLADDQVRFELQNASCRRTITACS